MTELDEKLRKCYECYKTFANGNADFDSCKNYQDYKTLGFEICPFITSIQRDIAKVKSGAVKRRESETTLVAVVEKLVEEGY